MKEMRTYPSDSKPDANQQDINFGQKEPPKEEEKQKDESKISEVIAPDSSKVPENLEYSEADLKERERIINKCKLEDFSKLIKGEDGKWCVIDIYGMKMKPDDYYDIYVSSYDSGNYENMIKDHPPIIKKENSIDVKKRGKTEEEKNRSMMRGISRIVENRNPHEDRVKYKDPLDPNL